MDTKVNVLLDELKVKLSSAQETKEKHEDYYKRKHKDLHETNSKTVQQTLSDLNNKVEKLTKLYEKTPAVEKSGVDSFIYQKPLADIFREEEGFTATLTEYTRKQFFGGISDLAGGHDKSKYELLDTGKPETFLVKGDSGDVKEREREELKRLQSSYLKSKRNCVNAEISNVKYKKAVEIAERQLKMLKSLNNFDVTHEQLAEKIESVYSEINMCQHKLRNCYGSEFLPLLEKLRLLNSTKVIQGDYNLKLLRQDYFISKQNEVIKQLLVQFSRNYLLTMLYEMEFKAHTNTHHLLSTLGSLLLSEIENIEKRISLSNQMISDVKPGKQIISSNDLYMNRIYEAIYYEKTEKPELYRSYNDLNSAVSRLSQSYKRTKGESEMAETEKSDYFKQIEMILSDAERMMVSTKDKSNEELSVVVTSLEENLAMVEVQINEVINDVMEKKTMLSVDRTEEIKRTVFADFLNDPARLKRKLDDLLVRVSSLSTSSS